MRVTTFSLAIVLLCSSCASIPPQAPRLSEELGKRISALEAAHLTLLNAYFVEKKEAVDDFVRSVWLPEFTKNVLENEQVRGAWEEISKSKDVEDRSAFLIDMGIRLQGQIDSKKDELIKPLNDLQREVEQSIREEYDLARSANNTLTSFLNTASKIEENRNTYLRMLDISENKMANVVDETDEALANLVNEAENFQQYQRMTEEYLKRLTELKEKIKSKK